MPDTPVDRDRDLYGGGGMLPIPDPTLLTTQQLNREISALKEIINTRLNAMDKAQEKFESNLQRVPSETDKAIMQLRQVMDQALLRVDSRFSASDAAVQAALAAAKEVIAVQQRAGSDAIDKAERATAKQIDQIAALFQTAAVGLEGKISDIKDRITIIESVKAGQGEQRTSSQGLQVQWVGIIGLIFGVIVGVGGLVVGLTTDEPPSSQVVERVIIPTPTPTPTPGPGVFN